MSTISAGPSRRRRPRAFASGSRWRLAALVAGLVLAVVASGAAVAAPAPGSSVDALKVGTAPAEQPRTYTNPVGAGVADDFADPSIIRGRDGYWYAYSTQTPLVEGGTERHLLPILRSPDLVRWEYVGDVFDATNRPAWLDADSGVWGAAIEYWDGEYRLFYVGVDIPGHPKPNKAIGVATGPTPAGPWTDAGAPVTGPSYYIRPPGDVVRHRSIIAPDAFQAADGRRYLSYGGFNGGIWVVELDAQMATVGAPVQLVDDAHFEGAYLVRRDDWYYMFVSPDHCCLGGPVSGYAGWVARSRSPKGPFVDRDGVPVHALRPGGTPVVTANGNRWVGMGANSVTTDLAGQDWLFYHAIDREDPYLNGPYDGGLQRGLLIDRLDWIAGWPTVRGGRGSSGGPTASPEVTASTADAFESASLGRSWLPSSGWVVDREPAGGFVRTDASSGERMLTARESVQGDVRVRTAVRIADPASREGQSGEGSVGLRLFGHGGPRTVDISLDAAGEALTVSVVYDDGVQRMRMRLPADLDLASWHDLTVEIRGGRLSAVLADVGADHPVAEAHLTLPPSARAGSVALRADGTAADFDDVTVARLFTPHRDVVPPPAADVLDTTLSEEFDGDEPGPQWQWIRPPDAGASVRAGGLELPVGSGNLLGTGSGGALLARDVPEDEEWAVEARVNVDFGEAPLWGFPMAGLAVYAGADEFLLSVVHGRNVVRDTRLVRETVYADRIRTGDSFTGPPGGPSPTWLRLHHTRDLVTGEHRFRGASSLDGRHWTWGSTFTMPATTRFDVGVMTGGAHPDDAAATARFDFVRFLRPAT
jgi:arabinan endo-1,5-alpha-L-arabinosidase